ncbi:hypothetical protein [Microbacterium sp. GXF7504]
MGKADKLMEQARQHLESDEVVEAAEMGAYEAKLMGKDTVRNGVLIATDRRVVFYAKKLGRLIWSRSRSATFHLSSTASR